MNKKRNTIIAIIVTILVIGVFIFASVYSINKTPTRADLINEQLRAQNASWVAANYPEEIYYIPINNPLDEGIEKDDSIKKFTVDNQKEFFPEETNTDDLNLEKRNNNTRLTGAIILATNLEYRVGYKVDDKWSWDKYLTPDKNQSTCGSCVAFTVLGAIEGYINKKDGLIGKNKLNLSEQYLISYTNFRGCNGTIAKYYLNLISLNDFNSKEETINNYLTQKIIKEINMGNKLINNTKMLQTETQLALSVGEVPFGVPLENQFKYLSYDSCEINKLDGAGKPITGMNLSPLTMYSTKDFTPRFCKDNSDTDEIKINGKPTPTKIKNKVFIPTRKDELNKYFIERYFTIDNADCKDKNSKTITNIKAALKYTPVIASIKFSESIKDYKEGIWSKWSDEKNPVGGHAIIITGWGVDNISGKEYWIIKNSWGPDWGDDGYFRIWMNDNTLNMECRGLYGLSGGLIEKSGSEINALLPVAKEKQRLAKELEEEQLKIQTKKIPQPITPVPTPPTILDPLREYNIININYLETENITNVRCVTINNCIYNKLTAFYGNNKTEEKELT